MLFHKNSMSLIALPGLLGMANAIIFDGSCSVYQEDIENAFGKAFILAALGAQKLNPPVNEPYHSFASWLFGDQAGWDEARGRLDNVHNIPSTFSSNKNDKSNLNDVIVYCNMDRYQKIKAGPYRDTDLNELIPGDDDLVMCKTGKSINGQRRPKAVTNSYSDPQNPDQYLDIMSTIDLCNWYLEEVKKAEWDTASDVASEVDSPTGSQSLGTLIAGALKEVGQALLGPGKRDMDTLALVDQTLLHELTHARAVGRSQTRLGVDELYGWQACTGHPTPYNSDSLAFFALACQIVDDGTLAISQVGLVETPPGSDDDGPGSSPESSGS